METLQLRTNPEFEETLENYPEKVRAKMNHLRKLVHEVASESEEINDLEETLKWGEPSFLAKKGSTIRMDWKAKQPDQYAFYFKCTSRLVPTFRAIYRDTFKYEGNRAIVFNLDDAIPEEELKACLKAALNYHRVKQMPMLGI